MSNNRTDSAMKNSTITLACQIVNIIVSFTSRTIFTKILGTEYLGLNGLFSNILLMLSFAELGIGSALVYKFYKPLKENDQKTILIYLTYFKKIYNAIALVVGVAGALIMPFLDRIVNAQISDINITIIYILFLFDTIISYLYVYKKTLLIADQKSYVVSVYTQISNIIKNIVQIIIIIGTHNYYLYLIASIVFNWLGNIAAAKRAERDYPYIKGKTKESISDPDKKEIVESTKGLLLGKIASVVFDGTDNIFINMFAGLSSVGIFSNYTLVLSTFNGVLNQVVYSIASTVGNLGVDSDSRKIEDVFNKIYFLNTIIYGLMFMGSVILIKPFVTDIWLDASYSLSDVILWLVIIEFTLRGIHYPVFMVRSALGRFQELKIIPLICAAINLFFDYLLGIEYGISGIIIATIISRTITRIADIIVLYGFTLKINPFIYYKMHLKYIVVISVISIFLYFICTVICFTNVYLDFLAKLILTVASYLFMIILFFSRSKELNYYKNLFMERISTH